MRFNLFRAADEGVGEPPAPVPADPPVEEPVAAPAAAPADAPADAPAPPVEEPVEPPPAAEADPAINHPVAAEDVPPTTGEVDSPVQVVHDLGYDPFAPLDRIFKEFVDAAAVWALPLEWLAESIKAGHPLPHEDFRGENPPAGN